jgi:hypothetical protein
MRYSENEVGDIFLLITTSSHNKPKKLIVDDIQHYSIRRLQKIVSILDDEVFKLFLKHCGGESYALLQSCHDSSGFEAHKSLLTACDDLATKWQKINTFVGGTSNSAVNGAYF